MRDQLCFQGEPRPPDTQTPRMFCLTVLTALLADECGMPGENPVSAVTFLDEQNVRDRVLTPDEFQRIVNVSPDYLMPVLRCADDTGMRRGAILGLTWYRINLKAGFIRLREIDTKTGEGRNIPIGRELSEALRRLPVVLGAQGRWVPYVFKRNGQRIKSSREVFARVCREAGIENFVFHDLRHTATTNLRRAGVDGRTAMKITGHKTMEGFRRYNTIDEQDLLAARRRMDTYMDTSGQPPQQQEL
jgi:integrase